MWDFVLRKSNFCEIYDESNVVRSKNVICIITYASHQSQVHD